MGVQKKGHPDVAFGYMNGYVNLTCIAEAEPNANFTWYRSGNKVLSPKQNKIFNGEHISMLQVCECIFMIKFRENSLLWVLLCCSFQLLPTEV